jgi:uncharacterized protein (DUF305 family)
MKNIPFRGIAATALALTALVGRTSDAHAQSATQAKADPRYVAKARADSAQYPYTAADIYFMQGMIHHHSQALVMAKWAPTHGASPAVLTLCNRIINAQNDEIALMSNWLRDRNQEVPDPTPGPMKMKMNGMEHEMLMPGMLSPEEMKDLDQARGKDWDVQFLRGMIKHHTGAVSMVRDLLGTYGAAQDVITAKLSQDVQIDQLTEIERMQKMLVQSLGLVDGQQ